MYMGFLSFSKKKKSFEVSFIKCSNIRVISKGTPLLYPTIPLPPKLPQKS